MRRLSQFPQPEGDRRQPDERTGSLGTVETLSDLQEQELVYSVLEEGGEPGKERELDRWWAIADEGWNLLGLIKSPKYGNATRG